MDDKLGKKPRGPLCFDVVPEEFSLRHCKLAVASALVVPDGGGLGDFVSNVSNGDIVAIQEGAGGLCVQ